MPDCLCGKKMIPLGTIPGNKVAGKLTVWTCPPSGCGRIYLESPGLEIDGTYYLAEQNTKRIGEL